jgi:hypothetical protein
MRSDAIRQLYKIITPDLETDLRRDFFKSSLKQNRCTTSLLKNLTAKAELLTVHIEQKDGYTRKVTITKKEEEKSLTKPKIQK